MAKRSLTASSQGRKIAKQAFERRGITQNDLAMEVGLSTRQSVWKFFSGKPVDRIVFLEICHFLNLDWEEIADLPKEDKTSTTSLTVAEKEQNKDFFTESCKDKLHPIIESQCANLHFLEIGQPIDLELLYTDLNVFPYLSKEQWVEIPTRQNIEQIKFNFDSQIFSHQTLSAVDIIKQYPRLLIFGKPGSGKSTLLQYITLQCQKNNIFPQLVPAFIRLNLLFFNNQNDSVPDLINFLYQQWQVVGFSQEEINNLFKNNNLFLLFDGLDEISASQQKQFLHALQNLLLINPLAKVIITSRNTSGVYDLNNFKSVEIADFNSSQIEIFVRKWFTQHQQLKSQELLRLLELPKNEPLKELIRTPIFLCLICSIFQSSGSLPTKRAKIYQIGLDILLRRWDNVKGISRQKTFLEQTFSLADKIKLLSEIAYQNFWQGKYLLEKLDIIFIISDFIANYSYQNVDREQLLLDSENILDSIEEKHGLLIQRGKEVYSFSHLTFQEYLTARKIVNATSNDIKSEYLKQIDFTKAAHREVVMLLVEMSSDCRPILNEVKKYLDKLLESTPKLIKLLEMINHKVQPMNLDILPSALRGFYLSLFVERDLGLAVSLDISLASSLPQELELDLHLNRLLAVSLEICQKFSLEGVMNLSLFLDIENKYNLDSQFQKDFTKLKERLLLPNIGEHNLKSWWQTYGKDWIDSLRQLIVDHRYYGKNYQFNHHEQETAQEYYFGNIFLLECLNHGENIEEEFKQKLIKNLLLYTSLYS